MKKILITSALYTLVTAVLLGIAYPLAITGIAQVCMRDKANGQLIVKDGQVVGSKLLGQPSQAPVTSTADRQQPAADTTPARHPDQIWHKQIKRCQHGSTLQSRAKAAERPSIS